MAMGPANFPAQIAKSSKKAHPFRARFALLIDPDRLSGQRAAMVVDTHCHLDLVAERGIEPFEALRRARERGVTDVVQISVDLDGARHARNLSQQAGTSLADGPRVHWTAGIHPEAARADTDLDSFERFVREHCREKGFVGVGETGLDYFHGGDHAPAQKRSFERHLQLAQELALPLVVHLRDSEQYDGNSAAVRDALDMVRAFPGVRGVLHCFTYGFAEAVPFVELGWFVSYSGIVTFRNAKAVQEGAGLLPLEALLVETDAPFLAPVPHRGRTNEPAFVADTLHFLKGLRAQTAGEDEQTVEETIFRNSQRFLSWKENPVMKESNHA